MDFGNCHRSVNRKMGIWFGLSWVVFHLPNGWVVLCFIALNLRANTDAISDLVLVSIQHKSAENLNQKIGGKEKINLRIITSSHKHHTRISQHHMSQNIDHPTSWAYLLQKVHKTCCLPLIKWLHQDLKKTASDPTWLRLYKTWSPWVW